MQGCATPKAAAAPLRVPAGAAGAPHPLARALRATQRHPPERPGASSPLFPEPLHKQQQLQHQAWGKRAATASSLILGASSDPALADPRPRGARGPAPKCPLTQDGSRGSLRCSQSPPPEPLAAAAQRWGSGRGGWVEDATPDRRERKKRKQEPPPPPPPLLNGAFGASD